MRWFLKLILLAYLTMASASDIRRRTVSVRAALVLSAAAAAGNVIAHGADLSWLLGILPGIFLLGTAWLTRESVGYGDGCVLLAVGLILGAPACTGILLTALLTVCPVSLAILIWKKDRRKTLPFVPFLLGAYIVWLLI